jgi:magnesium transporter
MAMGGNTGIQSSTLVVRSLALGTINRRSVLRLLLKEVAAGAIMGLICGIATGVLAVVFIQLSPNVSQSHTAQHLASIVAISLATAMSFAAIFGASVPMLLHRLRVDPAVASGPFVTITNDIFALLIYFLVTTLLVQQSF